jgi:hypothetical protein
MRVRRVGSSNGLTTLLLDDGRPLVLATEPDTRAAARVSRRFDRLVSLHLVVHGEHATCELRGVRHRQPASLIVPLAVALAFARAGLTTSVCTGARRGTDLDEVA